MLGINKNILIGIALYAAFLIQFNIIWLPMYSHLIPGIDCQVTNVNKCDAFLSKISYYECDLDLICYDKNYNNTMIRLSKIPNINSSVYNQFDDLEIKQYELIAFFINFGIPMIWLVYNYSGY
jgi:hypothetical protein